MTYRLGSYLAKHLEVPTPEWVKDRLKRSHAKSDVLQMLDELARVIRDHEIMMANYCAEIRLRARRQGKQIVEYMACCTKRKGWCGTCLGKNPAHGPNWKMKDGEGKWRTVRRSQEKDFLRQFLDEEDINEYYHVNQMRIDYTVTHNYLLLRLKNDGLVEDEDFEWRRPRL